VGDRCAFPLKQQSNNSWFGNLREAREAAVPFFNYVNMSSIHLIHPDRLKAFVFAGRAQFTIKDHNFNTTLAVRVRQNESNPDMFWVRSSSEFLGTIYKERFVIKETIASDPKAHFFLKFFTLMITGQLPDSMEVYHHTKCGMCSRPLTDPLSIEIGIGPDCRKKLGIDAKTARV
jgi:hypothetical protein